MIGRQVGWSHPVALRFLHNFIFGSPYACEFSVRVNYTVIKSVNACSRNL